VSHQSGNLDVAGSDRSEAPILSRDGSWIAYASLATDLMDGQVDSGAPSWDVFVYDTAGGKNILASHTAKDDKTVASGDSVAPEISNDGLYVAFESVAKDLDPNQNDGNGTTDVFLYNRRWNNTIVASRRFASLAISGDKDSYRPALAGDGLTVAFTSRSGDLIADDPETGGLEDVFAFQPGLFYRGLNTISFISARSTATANTLEWVTPPVDYARQELYVSATCPANYGGAVGLLTASSPPANTIAQFTDPTVYAAGTSLCYSMFVERDAGPIISSDVPARTVIVRTLETSGAVSWASMIAGGFTALAQVGIGTQNLVAVAQDGGVYGLARGATGGFWSAGYRPFRVDFSPIQGRPPVLSLPVKGSTRTTFVGSQDGRVYAYDADRGAGVGVGGALWYTTPALGTLVQPGVAGVFATFGGVANHVLIGAHGAPNTFHALDALSGAPRAGSPFSGGGFPLGAVNGTASVDYTRSQVYFASLEPSAGDPTLWCLKLAAAGLGSNCWSSPGIAVGGISGGPVERNGVVYVGTDTGVVRAIDAATGAVNWSFAGCGGTNAVKSYVFADRLGSTPDLYYATSAAVCAATDGASSASLKWQVSSITSPSAPVLVRIGSVAYVYVGSSDGRLYQIQADDSTKVKSVLVRSGATVGAPAFDVRDNMIYVGTDAGAIYAVQAPLL
jgi:hypothetical protein